MRRRAKGHVLALFLACVAGVGALVAAGAQWRLSQQRAAAQRWQVQAAEVLAESALVQAAADRRAGSVQAASIELAPGVASVTPLKGDRVRACGQVKTQRICRDARWTGDGWNVTEAFDDKGAPSAPASDAPASED